MQALTGIRVLELTHMVSGPYAGLLMADLGAETIKVEPPIIGEMTRRLLADDERLSVEGIGPYFLSLNRNKKSVTINLKSEKGLLLFYDLVKVSDVVLNNYSVGVTERLKIDHNRLSEINSKIITCSITGFGETGPAKHYPAYDIVAQAMSGVMSITGNADGFPTRAGYPIADVNGSMMGVIGILAALVARNQTDRGQHVDISMLDTQVSALNYMATIHLLSKDIPGRLGSEHLSHVPYNVYACKNGHIILAVVTDKFWGNLMEVLDLPQLNTIENQSRDGRIKNREQINKVLQDHFLIHTKDHWLIKLRDARIPCAPVNNFSEAFSENQIRARNMIVEVPHTNNNKVRMPGNPIKLSDTYEDEFTPAPSLGEHNQAYFETLLGKLKKELESLKSEGVI